jgi:sialate O-acetylesterase
MSLFKKIFFALILFTTSSAWADIRLPKILSSNMVLQREKSITIWGWASVGEKVTVQFNKQTKSTKADKTGSWMVSLAPEAAGGPYTLTLKGKNILTLTNILVGEVWVCSGQSNMEWPVRLVTNAEAEIQTANFPEIRHFTVEKSVSTKPEDDVKGGDWKVCSPQTVGDFTAVGYFFARDVYQKTKIPIGLVHTSWGGTHSETWTSRKAFEQSDEFKNMIASMPNVDLEQMAKQKRDAMEKKLAEANIKIAIGNEAAHWKEADFDHSQWPMMKVPQQWESTIGEVNGTIWFRKNFEISVEDAAKSATIELNVIDDNDETFVNGVKVGSINGYNIKRIYTIPSSILRKGKNVVAVKIIDTGGGGGMYGEAKDIRVVTQSQKTISLAGDWNFQIESLSSSTVGPNSYPTLLFNAMLNPILNLGIRGALWYQGESNAGRAYQYRKAFPLMIQDWRANFKQGEFPFYFVQLASFNSANGDSQNGSSWAELREAQTMTLSLPNTGMAVATDIGEANDIHPRNKQDVGKRLAVIALNRIYNIKTVDGGPMYQSIKVEGNKIRVTFSQTGSGLMIKDKYGYLKGFEVAGSDHKFHFAKAWIEGNEVVVASDAIADPIAVHFAWADNPEDANLFNNEGFPAVPFRTDNWKGITEGNKFTIE